MDMSAEQIVADWIAYGRYATHADAPEQVQADGMSMLELPEDDPELTWDVIRRVISQYSENDLFAVEKTEAQRVVGRVAAGPLEDLLGYHGGSFIDRVEAEARSDRRMAWALGGVWQLMMPDDLWGRVESIADRSYWVRASEG
ncbi:DUF6869 domain-containing protein [Sphingomonas sp.]|uniref:DUF6869 domain-containing protein n=1 Tax=Sphingomonas sp. TaxID=28214 RepID=UPI003D6C829D